MLLIDAIKEYAGQHKTDRAIYGYLDTEDLAVRFDVGVRVEDVNEEWLRRFRNFAGADHARRVQKVVKYFRKLVFDEK